MGSKVFPYSKKRDRGRPKIIEALASAVHEWVLMFLLFIEARFSYLVTKFARNHHLETPCVLCSRLDHVFGKERTNYYLDLICHKHKLQMSSLVLCHYHRNLVDVHEMCENCLFSFAVVNKSNAETYRLLVGKMGDRPQVGLDGNSKTCSCCHAISVSKAYVPQMSPPKSPEFQESDSELKHPIPWFVSSEVNEHKVPKDETYRAGKVSPSSMSNFNPIPHLEHEKGKLTSEFEPETPLSKDVAASFLLKDHCKRCLAELGVGTSSDDPVGEKFVLITREFEPSQMESEVKHEFSNTKSTEEAVTILNPGSEGMNVILATPDLMSFADDPFSPRIIGNVVDLHKETLEEREEAEVETEELQESAKNYEVANPSISLSTSEKQSHSEGEVTEEAEVETEELKESAEYFDVADPSISLSASEEQSDLEGDIWEEAEMDTKELKESAENCEVANPSISLSTSEEQSHSKGGVRKEVEVETKEIGESAEDRKVANPSISLSTSEEQLHSEGDVREESEVKTKELKESAENYEVSNRSISSKSEEQSHSESDIGGRGLQMPDSLELGDAYKLAVNSRRRQLSGKLLEQRSLSGKLLQQRSLSFKESPRGNEDFHILLSQLSIARGIDLPSNMSPSFRQNLGELTGSDASSSAGTRVLQTKVSLKRNNSNISLDGSSVNELEGESEVDRLKRQVDHDKKLMYALYKELEEERNASAIAANQAMAMITRLQEEKAAVNMEALQCIRMMDEQVGYDEEGLETARNLLTEKDEVVQELEFKLQLYTQKYGPLSIEDFPVESFTSSPSEELGADDIYACHVGNQTISNPESNMEDTFDSQAGDSKDRNQLS